MKTQMGEYVVGAYLKLVLGFDVVDYNVRPPGGGLQGLAEFDVVGLKFGERVAFVCEVTTHLDGINYGNNQKTVERIRRKFERQQLYAETCLTQGCSVLTQNAPSPRLGGGLCNGLPFLGRVFAPKTPPGRGLRALES